MIFSKNFNIDAALRYQPIVKKLESSKWRKYPILEIGSGTNGVTDYYEGEVIGLDSDFSKTKIEKNKNIEHKKGSIVKLPFKESSFYQVICVDTLEHLPKTLREKATFEMLRVTKKGGFIYLGFPSGKLSAKFEGKIRNQFKGVQNYEHPWLKEHLEYGLPEKEEILNYFYKNGVSKNNVKVLGNVNILIWYLIHLLFTVYDGKKIFRLLKLLVKPIFIISKINFPPLYRKILIIQR